MAEKIGFAGIGIMGTPMSKRLLAAGYPLVVYDIKPEAVVPLLDLGAEAASSPAELASRCSRVVTMLPNSTVVEDVVLGQNGLSEGFVPGSVLIDMSSSVPTSTKKIAAELQAKSVEMIDAPVTGGQAGAKEGTLTIMVGGDERVVDACTPILRAIGRKLFHIGPIGAGHTIKTINNMLFAINMLGVAEALVLGVKAGLDPERMVEVIRTGSGQSFAMDAKTSRHIFLNNYQPGFTTDLLYKDVDIATTLGRQLGVPLLAANLAQQVLAFARGRGMNALDNSCILKLIEEAAEVKVRSD